MILTINIHAINRTLHIPSNFELCMSICYHDGMWDHLFILEARLHIESRDAGSYPQSGKRLSFAVRKEQFQSDFSKVSYVFTFLVILPASELLERKLCPGYGWGIQPSFNRQAGKRFSLEIKI